MSAQLSKKLNVLFRELTKRGFYAQRDVACCQTCSHAEIEDLLKGRDQKYAFTHAQDEEGLQEGYIHIGFDRSGLLPVTDEEGAAIGAEIVEVAESLGFVVSWNGAYSSRPKLRL